MAPEIDVKDSTSQSNLFRRYWRTFLPLWLTPFPIVAVVLVADFASPAFVEHMLPYLIIALLVYVVVVEIQTMGPWRRGEMTYWQGWILSLPLFGVTVACLLLRVLVLQLFGQPD